MLAEELLKRNWAPKLKKRGDFGLNSKQTRAKDLPAIWPIGGKDLKVFVGSCITLN